MKRNVNELQFGNNTNNLNFKISKQQKKNNGNLTSRSKAKTSYINLAYTGNNTTRTFQNSSNFPYNYSQNNYNKTKGHNNNTENYEYILDKLLRYLETKMSKDEYNETKKFLKKEISQLVINGISNDNINKNDSISSLIASLSNNKDTEENYFNKDNIILTNENIKSNQNRKYTITNVEKYSSSLRKEKERKNNEKKLKLSYDFSNILSSPKNKILKKNKSTSKSKNKIKNKNINIKTKDIHSLYSIIKNKHKINETYNKKSKINQTQSNSKSKSKSKTESKSKSKSKSTSRECSNHNNNSTFCKNFNFSNRVKFHPNKSENFGKTYSHNSQPNSNNFLQNTFIPTFTIKQLLCQNYLSKNNKNSNYYDNQSSLTNRKVTNIKPTIINKTQPLLNEKLFSKIGKSKNKSNNKNNNKKQMSINNENKNKKLIPKKKKYNEHIKSFNFSKINNNSHTNSKSKSSRIRLNRNKQHSFPKPKKPEINKKKNNNILTSIDDKKIPNSTIDLTKEKKKSSVKNEEIMKQIKNTIDDNLKIMLNFSYENFLSKESGHESKDVSREIEINESNGNLSSNN